MAERPTVSVVVPFAGSDAAMEEIIEALRALSLRPGDELIVVDNRPGAPTGSAEGVRLVSAGAVRTPGYARNEGARISEGDWIVFLDADTRPSSSLLEHYFDPPPRPATAVLAGAVIDAPSGHGLPARHSVARGHMSQRATLTRRGMPYAQTANCAVLRSAFESVGGFDEQARAGEDADLCFRLLRAGYQLEERPAACVDHLTRNGLIPLLGQLARHGSGAAWLERRYPGEFEALSARALAGGLLRACTRTTRALLHAEWEAAGFALLDAATLLAFECGRMLPNHPHRGSRS